ncbi:ABC transporter ATP-binding protein [Candidatus Giovannonibacteria bacterium]|nr:ABC transporter ATP-binding protein [Candidatus Giovannonibacteria bacterium]
MEPIIKLENVDYYYDKGLPSEVHAIKNVSLEIGRGEYMSFFGPSGCGKTTLLYAIAGVEKPNTGKIFSLGQNLMELSQKEIAIYRQMAIGIIFQNFNLIPSIKNIDNVTLPMAFLGISASKRTERAHEIFSRLNIAHLENRFPFEISGGQQQRVGIARALANDPPIILADEPIGNLDSENAINVLNLLKELNEKDGKTIIMVTHEAWSLRDVKKVFYIADGAITKTGEKEAPKKKKVGTAYYYQDLFPELPGIDIRAKSLSALILRGYPHAELKRMEFYLSQRLGGKIDEEVFRAVLDRPYRLGGVGLWKRKAEKIAQMVETIIKEEEELGNIYRKLEENPERPLEAEIEKVKDWLFEGIKVHLSALQIDRISEVIGERIRNIITPESFQKVLDLSKNEGGVGLRIGTSHKIADRMEYILKGGLGFANLLEK